MIDRTVQYFSIVRKSQVPCIIKCRSSALPFETFQTTEIRNIDSEIKKKTNIKFNVDNRLVPLKKTESFRGIFQQ